MFFVASRFNGSSLDRTPQDYFHIGYVGVDMGNAFACSMNLPEVKYVRSPNGMIVNSASFETVLVNRDGKDKKKIGKAANVSSIVHCLL